MREEKRRAPGPGPGAAPAKGHSGESQPRARARGLTQGRGRYTDDLRLPRLVHAAFVRSPFAHARITALDLAAARAAPGVVGAFSGQDLLEVCAPWTTRLATFPQHRSPAQGPLAADRALWQGQPVALIVAETRALAEDGAALVQVEWDALPAVADPHAALAAGAAPIHPELGSNLAFEHRLQTPEAGLAFARADQVLTRSLQFSRHTGVPLEARSIAADFDPALRRLTVYQSTQVPHQTRAILADCFGLAEQDVRVITPDVGGGFGVKLHCYDDEMAVCAAAIRLGRPVKFVCDRLEAMVSDIHARAHQVEASIAVSTEGRILGLRVDDLAEAGAYSAFPRSSILEGLQAVNFAGLAYGFAHYDARLRVVYQNKMATGSYRGVGQPIACGLTEAMVDVAARTLGIDPAQMRRINFRSASHGGPKTPAGIDAGELSHAACLDRLLELMDYSGLREAQVRGRKAGRHLGIGLASFVEQNAPGPGFYGLADVKISASDGCTLRLEPSGTLTCICSNADQGQGVETAIAQLIAGQFDIPVSAVRVFSGDTATTPVGGGTFASRGLAISGEAALAAALQLREALAQAVCAYWASSHPGAAANPGDIGFESGRLHDRASGRRITLAELADLLHYKRHRLPPASTAQTMVSAQVTLPGPFLLANGIQASLVELDLETGFVKLLKHWVVEDCGRVVNPLLADEQLRGGVVQGIGAALFEDCRYDSEGQFLAGTLADYLVPMAMDMPDIIIGHVETPVRGSLLGGKGIGEAGTIGAAAAVGNAINDALSFFGAEICTQPYTPERILRALAGTR